MNFRLVIPLAPALLRPTLLAMADWMERTDRRLQALEDLANRSKEPC